MHPRLFAIACSFLHPEDSSKETMQLWLLKDKLRQV
jgi:hypothetical protein